MKRIGVVTDSHSGITRQEADRLGIKVLPMPLYIEGECYYEGVTLSREQFFERLRSGADIATSQPSPADVMKLWDEALEEYEQILYIPISSGLSGSCSAAAALALKKAYSGKVFVVDNGRVSALLHCAILDALELVSEGYSAEQIRDILEEARENMNIYIGVENLECLKRGGRISAATATLATVLNIKPVLQFDTGLLDTFKKCHGFKNARKTMIEAMRHDLTTRFRKWYDKGEFYLVAATSADPVTTGEWVEEIKEAFPGVPVMCDDLSLGTSSHIGYGGLGIGCSCRPERPRGAAEAEE